MQHTLNLFGLRTLLLYRIILCNILWHILIFLYHLEKDLQYLNLFKVHSDKRWLCGLWRSPRSSKRMIFQLVFDFFLRLNSPIMPERYRRRLVSKAASYKGWALVHTFHYIRMIIVSNLPMLITRKLDFILDWAIHAPNFKPRRQIIKDSTRKVQTQAVWTTKWCPLLNIEKTSLFKANTHK